MQDNEFYEWKESRKVSYRWLAQTTGYSERQLKRFASGDAEIPKVLVLALRYLAWVEYPLSDDEMPIDTSNIPPDF